MYWASDPAGSRDSNNSVMTQSLSMSGLCFPLGWLHSQACCLHGVTKVTVSSSQLLSHQPSSPIAQRESLPTRSSKSPRVGPHWPILGHTSIPQPIRVSKRLDGSAWPLLGHTPTPVLGFGVSPAQFTQWLSVREAWSTEGNQRWTGMDT